MCAKVCYNYSYALKLIAQIDKEDNTQKHGFCLIGSRSFAICKGLVFHNVCLRVTFIVNQLSLLNKHFFCFSESKLKIVVDINS